MIIKKNNFYIITGGPGVGKTTLLTSIEEDGFLIVPEVARGIIKKQIEINGNALPWKDTVLYTDLMLKASVESYKNNIENENMIFFDRAILDTVCYWKMIGNQISVVMDRYAKTYLYNKKVFILPPWIEIYKTDNERRQRWEEAQETYFQMKAMYEKYNYEVIDVPKDKVENRKDFVLQTINK